MTVLGMEITFVIGILVLIGGVVTKKKWVMVISILPLILVLVNLAIIFMMFL